MTKEERIQKDVNFFKEGYNCSQSVVAAYADLYGFTHEQALHMAASFGEESDECAKRVEPHVECFCVQVWNVVR